LKEIGCKSAWAVHISPLFWSIGRLLTCKTDKWGKQGWAALSPNSQNLSSPSRILRASAARLACLTHFASIL